MANTLITDSIITKYAMVEFKNAMVMLDKCDRQLDPLFAGKKGATINVRKRVRYAAVDGPDITSSLIDTVEGSIPVTLDTYKTVPLQFTSQDRTLKIEEFNERYIKPAMQELAQQVESAIASKYYKIWNFTGTPGTTPSTMSQIGTAKAIQSEMGVPYEGRNAFYTPEAISNFADNLKGVFPQKIAKTAIEEATLTRYAGYNIIECQSLVNHTVGALGGTPLVNGASQNVTWATSKDGYTQSLITDGWSNSVTGVVKAGDVFTIANVYSVNPKTRQSTGRLQTFTITADANSDGSGNATLTVSPPIITSGAYQTVDSAPADDAVITIKTGAAGSVHPQNLLFHKDAITVAFAKLEALEGAKTSYATMDNVTIRFSSDSDILLDKNIYRFDILFGVEVQNPGMAIRHTG